MPKFRKALALFFLSLFALMPRLYASEVTNGTIALLELNAHQSTALYKEGVSIPLLNHPRDAHKKIAFIAIPYAQTKTIELLHVSIYGEETLRLNLRQGTYHTETLQVAPSKVSPPKEELKRIQEESKEAKALYATFRPDRLWENTFMPPLESSITSHYGSARLFNKSLQNYHTGVDFRAAVGTPIYASNDGIVALAKERYYAGNSLIIDHGEGIYSVYYHLSALSFKKGERVSRGDVVGLSGVSGRVTGPHLHFGFMVQGIPVDPLDFIAKVNQLF